MSKTIQLYTTAGCHLCDQAEDMLSYLLLNEESLVDLFQLVPVEIAGDEALVEQYGVRIPVISCANKEIGWPFELEELKGWLLKSLSNQGR